MTGGGSARDEKRRRIASPPDETPRATPRGPVVAGEAAADRLMRSLDVRLSPETHRPSREQVAVVLHALADHTSLMAALAYQPGGVWPEARSLGRWLHDTGDQLTDHDRPTTAPTPTTGERIDLGDLLWEGVDPDANAMRAAFWDRDWRALEGAVKRLLDRAAPA